ncbi:AAA family ATPase [Deinococcus detaillensis]|uniref:AAA family ATPase n=1 Tax=Deinococcus detaillensis TaxID=2592048 RepID=A0A553UFS8_9DEIO|nr:AAA family ATPase [Deinococcus detaillensis]TSA79069.1 AAA family ATPase [Deinococcus detaillensis]
MNVGQLEIRLLGVPSIKLGGLDLTPAVRKGTALLAYLALEGPTDRHQLADLLWSDLDESGARRNLRQELWRLQHSSLAPWIEVESGNVALTSSFQIDVAEFHRHLAADDLPAALKLYHGSLLARFELSGASGFEDWLGQRREDLSSVWRDALHRHGVQLERQGDARGALGIQLQLLHEDEFQEVHQREAMRLHLLLGEHLEGLRRYERYARLLDDELGLKPLPETQALARTFQETAALSPEPSPQASQVPHALSLPLTGRSAEWNALQHSGAALSLVTGEPGIGKTRLTEAFALTFGARLHLRAYEVALATPLYPAAEALKTALNTPRMVERLSTLDPLWRAEAARLVPELALSLLHPESLQADGRARFLSGVARALTCAAGVDGVLIFDDLHWADPMTLELLLHLVRQPPEQRPRLIATARPQELGEQLTLLAALAALEREGKLQRVALSGLTSPDVLTLVQTLSGSATGQYFAARLFEATAGNPLYLLESLRHLFEVGVLTRSLNGQWATPFDESTTDYAELPLPTSIRDAIVQRASHYGPAARRLLEAASLSDGGFELSDLAPALSLSEWEAVETLERLLEGGLLMRLSAESYGFSHDLVRRVILLELGPERRRLIHRRLAERLESTGAAASRVARHLEEAGQPLKAAAWRIKAAQDAERVYAHSEALAHYELALADGVSDLSAFHIHLERELLFRLLGDSERRSAVIQTLTALATSLSEPALTLEVKLRQLALLNDLYHFTEADQLAKRLLGDPALQPETLGQVLYGGAEALLRLDEIGQAEEWYDRVIALGDAVPAALRADAHVGRRVCAVIRGDFVLAQAHNVASLEGHRGAGNRGGESSALNGIGRVAVMLGEYTDAQSAFEQALQTAEAVGDRQQILFAVYSMMWLESQRGHFRRCLKLYSATLELNAGIQNRGCAIGLEIYRSRALQHAGALGVSLTVAAAAAASAESNGSKEMVLVAQRYEALTRLALGDIEGAAQGFQSALNSIPGDHLRLQAPVLETGLARCALERGDLQDALLHLDRATAFKQRMYFTEQRDLELTLASVKLRLGETQPALDLAAQHGGVIHLHARSLALRLEALRMVGTLTPATVQEAQVWLETTDVSALEGLELRVILGHSFEELGRSSEAAQARRKADAQMKILGSALEAHPEWRRRFLEKYVRLSTTEPNSKISSPL